MSTSASRKPFTDDITSQLKAKDEHGKAVGTGTPIGSLVHNIDKANRLEDPTKSYNGSQNILDTLAITDMFKEVNQSNATYHAAVAKIVKDLKVKEIDGFGNEHTSYEDLIEDAKATFQKLTVGDEVLQGYLVNYNLSPEDYETYSQYEDAINNLGDIKNTLDQTNNDLGETQDKINLMNDPNWEIKTLQHLLQETATHELAMLQLKRKQRITLNHSKYKNKLANIIGLGNAKKDEQETAKREYITKVNKTAAQLGSHKDIKDIATIYVGNDPVSQLIQAKIKEVGTLAVTRANDLTALTTKKEALDLSVQSQQQKLTDTEALLENGLENYEALTEKVYLNNKEYIDRIIGIIQEKVSNGDSEMIAMLQNLGAMEIAIKSEVEKTGLNTADMGQKVEALQGALKGFSNKFVYPGYRKARKKKERGHFITKKSKALRKGVSGTTSAVSAAFGGMGLMHMIPGWVSNASNSSFGKLVKQTYTDSNGDISKTAVYVTGATVLISLFVMLEKFKRHIDHSIHHVGSSNIGGKSALKQFRGRFGTTEKGVLIGGLVATIFAMWSDASGVASFMYGGKKRSAEQAKVQTAIDSLENSFNKSILYLNAVDSAAGNTLQTVLDQESSGQAASGQSGKGKFYTAKALLDGSDASDVAGLNPQTVDEGKSILASAGGKEGQYKDIHTRVLEAKQKLLESMNIIDGKDTIAWSNTGKEAQRFTKGIDPTNSMKLKDLANKLQGSVDSAIVLLDSIAKGYNRDMTSLKQAYDKIESIAQSGKTLSISLVDTAMLNKEFAKIKKAGQASSGQIARIEPYMSFNHVMSFLKESGESDSQRNRALISIILVILSLHAIYPVWALVSLKRNKKDQTGELGAQFNELDKQHARLQAMLMQLLPAFVNSRNYDEMQELGKATLGSSEAFNGLMASVLQGETLNRKEVEDKEALTETMTTRTVQYITRNMEAIVRTHKKAIDAEMSANGLVLVDEDNDPLPYTDYYLNLGAMPEWAMMQFGAAFMQNSPTFSSTISMGLQKKAAFYNPAVTSI